MLLLPTGYYLAGGAAAVAASFVAAILLPAGMLSKLADRRLILGTLPLPARPAVSLAAFLVDAGAHRCRLERQP